MTAEVGSLDRKTILGAAGINMQPLRRRALPSPNVATNSFGG